MFVSVPGTTSPPQTEDPGRDKVVYIATQKDVKFDFGDKVDLYCKILKANEPITAQWKRNSTQRILKTKNYTAEVVLNQPLYNQFHHIIDQVSLDDNGLYTCEATYWNSSKVYEDFYDLRVRGMRFNSS